MPRRRGGLAASLMLGLLSLAPAPVGAQATPVVYPGARVQVRAPVVGGDWMRGAMATARVRGRICLGVALEQRDPAGNPVFILLRGLTAMQVDRRTNSDVRIAVQLPAASDSDWIAIDLLRLAEQDSACRSPAPPQQ